MKCHVWVAVLFAMSLTLAAAQEAPQQPDKSKPGDGKPVPADKAPSAEQVKAARAKALKWLADQQHMDRSWSSGNYTHNTAMTAYALQAFLANGHGPAAGTYRETVAKGMHFLLKAARPDGYLIGARGGNMYCHALATQALAELWTKTKDKTIEPVLTRAVDLIVRVQSARGGWRYAPQPIGEDISVTTMQVIALQAAKTSGIKVPAETLKKALGYIRSCADPRTGGYCYQPRAAPGFGRTAAGLRALQVAGEFKNQDDAKAITYLRANFNSRRHFFYSHVYIAPVLKEVGGQAWDEWRAKILPQLLAQQAKDGAWTGNKLDSNSFGPVYQTAVAVLILSVP